MSIQIPTHHVQQYRSAVTLLAQQKGSRYRRTARMDGEVVGKSVYYDRIGATAAVRLTTRHGDTPLMNTPHSRRKAFLFDYVWADLIDKSDKYKTLYDPQNFYVRMAMWAMGRAMDDRQIDAWFEAATEGEEGATSTAFPAGNQIAASVGPSTGLNLTKMLNAKELLDEGETDPDVPRFGAISADQVTDLLNTTQIQSIDYNSVKALVEGKINTFCGFEFVRSERLDADGSSDRRCAFYTEAANGFETGQDVVVDVGVRRDKNLATQIYVCMGIAAVRIEDAQIMEVKCTE